MKLFFLAFFGLFYLVGFAILGYGLWASWRTMQASHWPKTPGKLTRIELKDVGTEDSAYRVEVDYDYNVAGKDYHGSRLAFGYSASGGSEAHGEIFEMLKAAKSVDVCYDPDDPASAVLSYGIHRSIQFMLVFGATWLLFIFGFTLGWYIGLHNDNVLLDNMSVH